MHINLSNYHLRFNLFIIVSFMSFIGFSQNETNNWYFGKNAGIDFGNGDVAVLEDGSMITPAGCSSISDDEGNLMFYTNGQTVWNRNHQIMTNGEGLSGEIDGIQSAIIVPKPNDYSTYYVFYTRENTQTSPIYFLTGVYYSEIKFDTLNPLGYVTENKDIRIAEVESTSRIAAIHHPESNTIRVVCITKPDPVFGYVVPQGEFIFRIYNVTSTGVDIVPEKRPINENLGRLGAMKIAPDSSYIAFADSANQKVYFYQYDNDTINFQLYFTLPTIPAFGVFLNPYGIEFSQDSKNFYYSGENYVVQFPFSDLGGMEPVDYYLIPVSNPGSLQLARNGKIYIAQGSLSSPTAHLGVINNPEKKGAECNYSPANIQYENAESTKGLPLFVASYLRSRIIPSKDDCVDVAFSFELDAYRTILSVLWDFGDGTTSTDFNPTHLFSTPGTHKVKARIVMDNNQAVTLYKEVVAYPLPQLAQNQNLTQCDNDNDGFSVFNLQNIKDHADDINNDYTYTFYNSMADLVNEINPIQNYQQYTNTSNPEEIFVKIVSAKGCVTRTSFFLVNNQTNILPISTIYVCENSDGVLNNSKGKFNLGEKEENIRAEFGIPESFDISFYSNMIDAETKINPLDKYFTTSSTLIWIRIEDNSNNCFGIMSFSAVVNSNIDLELDDLYTICDASVQSPIILDGGNSNTAWLWMNSTGNIVSNSRFFQLSNEGNYSVTVTKLENGLSCSVSKSFEVLKASTPEFLDVEANNGIVNVTISGNSEYEFSLDGINYFGSGVNYVFTGVRSGMSTVYVRDKFNCEASIQTNFFMMSIPNYFTPNNDGYNDFWKINGLTREFYTEAEIIIFDRYGKVIHSMDMRMNEIGWSGMSNDRLLPAEDYWYRLVLTDLTNNVVVRRGHFSLKR